MITPISPAVAISSHGNRHRPAASAADVAAESKRLNEWFDKKYEEQLKFSPIQLTFQGRKDLYDQVDDMSEKATRDQVAWQQASVEEMEKTFDYAKLDDEAKFSYDLWKLQYENARDGLPFLLDGYAFDQMNGAQGFWPTFLISFHKVDEEADYTAYIARLKATQRAFDQLLERARASAAEGVRPPKFAYEGVIDQAKKVVTAVAARHLAGQHLFGAADARGGGGASTAGFGQLAPQFAVQRIEGGRQPRTTDRR